MYVVIWEYQVKAERVAEFEEIYSATGAWAKLFEKSKGYLGTELLFHAEQPYRYLTIDRWTSAQEFASFLAEWMSEYADLDARCAGFAEKEFLAGRWETVSSGTR